MGILKFNLEAGIAATAVPPQPTDAIANVLGGTIGGRTTYMLAPNSNADTPIRDGRLVALDVTTTR